MVTLIDPLVRNENDFYEVVKEFPLDVQEGTLWVTTGGVPLEDTFASKKEEYVEECIRKNLIPETLSLEYASLQRMFVPSKEYSYLPLRRGKVDPNAFTASPSVNALLQHNKKIHTLVFSFNELGYQLLCKNGLMGFLMDEEYVPQKGSIWHQTNAVGESEIFSHEKQGVSFPLEVNPKGLRLYLDETLGTAFQRKELKKWSEGFVERYGRLIKAE